MTLVERIKDNPAGFERHAITVLTLIIVALILWVGNGVQQTMVKLAAIEVELEYIKRSTTNDNGKFAEIERRLDAIERAIHNHSISDREIS